MKVHQVEIYPPRKASCIANAKVTLSDDAGSSIVIDDLRVIRNAQGQLWVAPPTYSTAQGKAWEYFPTVTFDRALRRQVEDAVLAAYESQQTAVR